MATLEQIGQALKNAHAAGDTVAAQKLAQAYQKEKARVGKTAAGKRGGMVTEGTISREEYLRQKGGQGFGGRPVPQDVGTADAIPEPSRVTDTLQAPGFAFGTIGMIGGGERTYPASGSLGTRTVAPDFSRPPDIDTPQSIGVPEKMTRAQSIALGVTDLNPVRFATGDLGFEDAITQSLKDNPNSTRIGQAAAFTAGGAAQLGTRAIVNAPKLVAPAVAARFAGPGLGAQAARYGGRLGVLAGEGTAGYYGYNALVEAPNQYREAGLPSPSFGQRLDYANSQVLTPGGAISAAVGPLASGLFRTGRGIVAGGKNALASGGKTILPQGTTSATPIANLFTPSSVQRNVANAGITPSTPSARGRTAREEAIDLLLAKGLNADDTEKLVKLLSYDRYTTVDEMLFELANADIDQLAVAAARVGGDAKKTFREAFKARNAEMPERIRTQLRDAMALSGDELEDFAAQMVARADEATADGYTAAYAQQVSDDTWARMWDRLSVSPDAADAIAAGARLARNSYRGNPAQLDVARQLEQLAGALGSPSAIPPKLSTHALDYLDRGFGSLIAGAKKNNPSFAASLIEIQKALRSAGLDADTGLNVPRGVYSQYKAAARAMDFGAKAFGRGTPLRDLKKQFAASLKDADEVFEDIVGEGRSVVDQALVMGWLRGAEDAIETATNPGALIRQIYGSERQRAKLMEMMPQETDVMTSGVKSDQTKRIKALVGSAVGTEDYKFGFTLGSGARAEGRTAVPSLFERQRTMLENQGRVSGNSVTGDVTEAIANQGGLQRAADLVARTVMNPQEAARNAVLWAVQRWTTPAIFKPEVNRELGRILTTRGRDELLALIDEIRARQQATGRTPRPPSPSTPSGPIRAGGFAGFGGRKPPITQPAKQLPEGLTIEPDQKGLGGTYKAMINGQKVGELVVDWRGPYVSLVKVDPAYQRSGIASALYDAAEADLGTAMIPSPLGISKSAQGFWKSRLERSDNPQAIVDQSIRLARKNNTPKYARDDLESLKRSLKPSGFSGLRTDLGNAAVGAGVGALGPAESPEERLRNMAIGAGVMGVGGRVSRSLGRNALAGETRTAGVGGRGPRKPTQAPSLPTYKANPVKGQGFEEWLDALYSDAMRGPDNKVVLPNVFYRGMSDAEFEAAQKAGKFQSINNREGLYVEKDPTRYTGGGAYGAKRGGVIVQFDTTGLTPKTIRSRFAGGFAEDGFDEIPNDKIARVWKWDAAKNDHVLVFEANGERSLPPIMPGGFAGGGGRGPRKPPGKLGTRAADAAAITTLAAGGPTAQADTGDGQQRINELSQRETAAQQLITEYEQGLKDFQNLSVKEKQIFLRDNGFTGVNGAILKDDGATGGNTTYAINNYTQKMQEAIAAAQAERELFRQQINDVRVSMAEQDRKPSNPWVDKGLEIGTYAAAIYAAHRFRGAALKGSQKAARLVEDDANALLTRMPVPPIPPKKTLLSRVPVVGRKEKARIAKATAAANKAARAVEERLAGRDLPPISSNPTSENGLPIRQANLGEFDRRRAAGDFGPVGPIGRFMEPVTSRFRPGDASIMAAGATDAYVMEGMLDKTRDDIATEEKRLDEARKARDPVRIAASNKRLEELRNIETTFTILQRVGIGLAIGGAIGVTHGRYAKPRPRFEAAERERELIRLAQTPPPANALAPQTTAPRTPRTPPAPKPKPPVSFSNARPRKPANDAD